MFLKIFEKKEEKEFKRQRLGPTKPKIQSGSFTEKKNVPASTDVLCLIAFLQGDSRIQTLHICNAEVFHMGPQVLHGMGRKS